jgi:DNA invertase Pin-like site-specific DNA recombinase
MTKIGYARVSSKSQSFDEQSRQLSAAGCETIRAEKESAKSADDRPELQTVLAFLREGDSLVVTRIDRLARSLRDLLNLVQEIERRGATLVVLHQNIDTSNPTGRAFLQMLGVFAEFERELIRERQAAGLAAARKEGRSLGGRRRSIDRESVKQLLAVDPPIPMIEIARRLKIGQASVYRIMEEITKEKLQ